MANPFPIPLNALRAIEIVARTGALQPAADELGVTPGAVSQHIRRAEARLEVTLFERTPQGLRPTEALVAVQPLLRTGFNTLAEAAAGLGRRQSNVLTLTVGSVFASRWLIWRVAKFSAAHPEIELRMVITRELIDFTHGDIDCGIRFGAGGWTDVRAEPVGGFTYQPVCSPVLAARLSAPADLANVPVIHDEASMLPWEPWWRQAGVADPPKLSGPSISEPSLAFDAAISDQGVLMAVDMMTADAVCDGRLVRPFEMPLQSDVGYWLAIARGTRMAPKVRAFYDWLKAEVPASTGGYLSQLRNSNLAFREPPAPPAPGKFSQEN